MSSRSNRREFLRAGVAAGLTVGAAQSSHAAAWPFRNNICSTPLLPQNDPHAESRQRQLARTRRRYQYNYTHLPPLAMVNKVPFNDTFSLEWILQVAGRVFELIENKLAQAGGRRELARHRARRKRFQRLTQAATVNVNALRRAVQEVIHEEIARAQPRNLEDYAALFRTIELPLIAEDFREDNVFALMRLAGPNPLMIHQIQAPDARFPVTEEMYQSVLPGDSMQAAGAEGRLYLADYQVLENVVPGTFPIPKFVYAPLSLYAVQLGTGDFVPIAIQCAQQPGPTNPVFTPQDGFNWLLAKTIVEIADANVHEAAAHLGRTHLFMEPFAVASRRQLAANHPLGALLRPHFEGTLAINNQAHAFLLANRGPVDRLLSGTIGATRQLAAESVQNYQFNNVMLPNTFQARGVHDPDVLPNYPYRDDSLLYWDAIRNWSADYLSVYYQSNLDVQQDFELQAWHTELMSQNGGRVVGFGQGNSLGTLNYLIDATTLILYTSSVQHAAVNFPQFDLMAYTPNMPLAGYAPPPTTKQGGTEEDYLELLPSLEQASSQLSILYLLGGVHYTTLGQYSELCDPRIQMPLADFQQSLSDIGDIIAQRNQQRRPYIYLDPLGIPQSINI